MKVTFDGDICKHSGECVKRSPEVFKVIDGNMVINSQMTIFEQRLPSALLEP